MTTELKLCPFCGIETSVQYKDWGMNVTCETKDCTLVGRVFTVDEWNNRPAENKIKADAVHELKNAIIKKASEMPAQLECRSKGSSCYNWAMYYAREATEFANKLEKGEV